MHRQISRRNLRKKETPCKCGDPHLTHYTREGYCVVPGCGCLEYRPSLARKEFNNVRAKCNYGHSHDSGLEIKTCFDLHCLKLAGEIKDFKGHTLLHLLGPSGSEVATYEIDFVVNHHDGTTEFLEAKGGHLIRQQPWPLKWALLQDMYKGNRKYKFRVVTR